MTVIRTDEAPHCHSLLVADCKESSVSLNMDLGKVTCRSIYLKGISHGGLYLLFYDVFILSTCTVKISTMQ